MANTVDVLVVDEGTVVRFKLLSKAAREWFDENVQSESWQWLAHTLVVDRRFASGLVDGLHDAGLEVR